MRFIQKQNVVKLSSDDELLEIVADNKLRTFKGAFNIRKNGKGIDRNVTENINIISKKDKPGIDIVVKENTKNEKVYIPVIVTGKDVHDVVYNDFYIGKNANVTIIAGCGIHNDCSEDSSHDGIHSFYLEEGAHVKYVEKHYGEGNGTGKRILNPVTYVNMKDDSFMEMETLQIKGVNSTVRETNADLIGMNSNLVINEKIFTHDNQIAKTKFTVNLDGENSSANVISRSVATDDSKQQFVSDVRGNNKSFAHVECDSIIRDNGKVTSDPKIAANHIDANLMHEAVIGKIAGEQLMKIMSLGYTEKEAEREIINGFLR